MLIHLVLIDYRHILMSHGHVMLLVLADTVLFLHHLGVLDRRPAIIWHLLIIILHLHISTLQMVHILLLMRSNFLLRPMLAFTTILLAGSPMTLLLFQVLIRPTPCAPLTLNRLLILVLLAIHI